MKCEDCDKDFPRSRTGWWEFQEHLDDAKDLFWCSSTQHEWQKLWCQLNHLAWSAFEAHWGNDLPVPEDAPTGRLVF